MTSFSKLAIPLVFQKSNRTKNWPQDQIFQKITFLNRNKNELREEKTLRKREMEKKTDEEEKKETERKRRKERKKETLGLLFYCNFAV